jgi:hypothetical protein
LCGRKQIKLRRATQERAVTFSREKVMHFQAESAASKPLALSTPSPHPAKWRRDRFFVNRSFPGLISGRPIVYRLNEKAAHPAIFVPSKVARARTGSS